MKKNLIIMSMMLLQSLSIVSSVHEERMKLRNKIFSERILQDKNNAYEQQQMSSLKGLACICLLLTPVSWKHNVTVPCQKSVILLARESDEESFHKIMKRNSYISYK